MFFPWGFSGTPINMCAWYCVSTSPCLWLISFISWNMALTNCWVEMTSTAGHVTSRARTSQGILLLPVRFLQISASDDWLPAETTWAEAGLGACLPLTTHVCERKGRQWRKGERQTAWPGCQLPLSSHYDSSRVRAPFPWFLQTPARLRYCSGGQLNVHLTERLRRKSPERKQKWSEGPFPTLFLAPVCPRRLKRTLPKQRVCLCRCPNSQPTHICTLAHRQRHTHAGT